MSDAGPVSRALGLIAEMEPREAKAVVISFVYFFFLMASYFILRPLRDTMGTVYGVAHLQECQENRGSLIAAALSTPSFEPSHPGPWFSSRSERWSVASWRSLGSGRINVRDAVTEELALAGATPIAISPCRRPGGTALPARGLAGAG